MNCASYYFLSKSSKHLQCFINIKGIDVDTRLFITENNLRIGNVIAISYLAVPTNRISSSTNTYN